MTLPLSRVSKINHHNYHNNKERLGVSLNTQDHTLWTFTIITTAANADFTWLHDRQPVILSSTSTVLSWLDTSSSSWSQQLTQLVQPYSDKSVELECYQVPHQVGKVGTESPTFIEPIASRKDGIQAMFTKQREQKGKRPRSEEEEEKGEEDRVNHSTPSKKFKHSIHDVALSPSKSKPQPQGKSSPTKNKPITAFFLKKS